MLGGGILTYYALNKIPAFGIGSSQVNKEVVDHVVRPAWHMFKEKAKTVFQVLTSEKVLLPAAGTASVFGWWYWLNNSDSDLEEA